MEIYYGIFYPLNKGWGVRFPDAPAIHTGGKNLDEALEMAVDALSGLMVMGRKGREYNAPQGYEAILTEAKAGELVFPVMPNEKNMDTYRPKKRVNVMIPADLLEKIDTLKDQKGLDRSRLICDAVEALF
jgi:predicted RNase H-like HicB family nuclease